MDLYNLTTGESYGYATRYIKAGEKVIVERDLTREKPPTKLGRGIYKAIAKNGIESVFLVGGATNEDCWAAIQICADKSPTLLSVLLANTVEHSPGFTIRKFEGDKWGEIMEGPFA